ncbi:hypothetical protein [Nocardia gipuzkoensis]
MTETEVSVRRPRRAARFRPPEAHDLAVTTVGPLDTAAVTDIVEHLPRLWCWPTDPVAVCDWRRGARAVLSWLSSFPGDGWQARWHTSGAEERGSGWAEPIVLARPDHDPRYARAELVTGLTCLMTASVIVPGYDFLQSYRAYNLYRFARGEFGAATFARIETAATTRGMVGRQIAGVLTILSKIVLHTGKDVDQLTEHDLLAFRAWSLGRLDRNAVGLHGAWDVLRDVEVLSTDLTLRAAIRQGQHRESNPRRPHPRRTPRHRRLRPTHLRSIQTQHHRRHPIRIDLQSTRTT